MNGEGTCSWWLSPLARRYPRRKGSLKVPRMASEISFADQYALGHTAASTKARQTYTSQKELARYVWWRACFCNQPGSASAKSQNFWGSPWGAKRPVYKKIFFLRSFLDANDDIIRQTRLLPTLCDFLKDWDDHGFLPSCRKLAEFKTAVEKTCQTFRDSRSAKFKKASWNVVKPSGFVCLEGGQDFVDFSLSGFEEGEWIGVNRECCSVGFAVRWNVQLLRRVAFSTAEDTVRWKTGSLRIEHGSFLVFPVSWHINVQKSRGNSAEGEARVLRWRLVAWARSALRSLAVTMFRVLVNWSRSSGDGFLLNRR